MEIPGQISAEIDTDVLDRECAAGLLAFPKDS
jgi:hypothetical protein